jgi:hypothetical protein
MKSNQMQRIARLSALLFLALLPRLNAQQATVSRNTDLRGDPSTKNPPLSALKKGASLTVVDADPKQGFLKVKSTDGQEGFVSAKALIVSPIPPPIFQPAPDDAIVLPAVSTACDPTLWDHVYHPQRLVVKQACISVTGTIVDATAGKSHDGVRHEADGDTHGWLQLDPQFQNLLNAGNQSNEGGNLVFEIVCKFPVTQADAKLSCANFKDTLVIPPINSRVQITGTYVQDTNHAQWMEIHPVSTITVIP